MEGNKIEKKVIVEYEKGKENKEKIRMEGKTA